MLNLMLDINKLSVRCEKLTLEIGHIKPKPEPLEMPKNGDHQSNIPLKKRMDIFLL